MLVQDAQTHEPSSDFFPALPRNDDTPRAHGPRFRSSRLRVFGGKENSLPAILGLRWGSSSSSDSGWTARRGLPFADLPRLGRATTIPSPAPGFAPTSPLEAILANRTAGLHTLVLLDLREDGTFFPPRDAIASLLQMASALRTTEFGPHTLACVLSRVGSPEVRALAGPIGELADRDLGPPPHSLVIPGTLHFLEKDALVAFAGAPHDL